MEISKQKIEDIFDAKKTFIDSGVLTKDEIQYALQLLESSSKPDVYRINLALHLVATGDLNDVIISLELIDKIISFSEDRFLVLENMLKRYLLFEDELIVKKIINLMQSDAEKIELSDKYFHSVKASIWKRVFDAYFEAGYDKKAILAMENAIKWASDGQYVIDNPHDLVECRAILVNCIHSIIKNEKYEIALDVARKLDHPYKDSWIKSIQFLIDMKPKF